MKKSLYNLDLTKKEYNIIKNLASKKEKTDQKIKDIDNKLYPAIKCYFTPENYYKANETLVKHYQKRSALNG
jgi:hypothetical protein